MYYFRITHNRLQELASQIQDAIPGEIKASIIVFCKTLLTF